jgi:hypothetical protein
MARIVRYPAQVISQSRNRCQRVKRPAAAVVWSEMEVVVAPTAVLYRPGLCSQQCSKYSLKGVQVGQKIVDLLLREFLAKTRHFVSSHLDDIRDTVVVGWHAAQREILLLEDMFHARPLASTRRIRRMTTIAVVVVDFSSRSLLRVQA